MLEYFFSCTKCNTFFNKRNLGQQFAHHMCSGINGRFFEPDVPQREPGGISLSLSLSLSLSHSLSLCLSLSLSLSLSLPPSILPLSLPLYLSFFPFCSLFFSRISLFFLSDFFFTTCANNFFSLFIGGKIFIQA